ncbi:MAG: phosphoribosylformylglycinamidine synthase [Oscillospiraceae bacterium]|nr:phosphoribosylformylglycinamidine synthase [Oscillospiraceae bacterium]
MAVFRCYVEKKPAFAVEAAGVLGDLKTALRTDKITGVRVLNRYDLENITPEDFAMARQNILSEPQLDDVYGELPETGDACVFAVEYLPGQFDQRADSAAQCIQISTCKNRPTVRTARVYVISGQVDGELLQKIKETLINPVEAREASLAMPETIDQKYDAPAPVAVLEGFIGLDEKALDEFVRSYGLAMDLDDIKFCQHYFKETEKRDPTVTEIRMIDTYWSDHCRHTTFSTAIDKAEIEPAYVQDAYRLYLDLRRETGREKKPVTLMDLATIGARALKKRGLLPALDESEEINACSVNIKVDVDGEDQDWLLMFKNETHNHPTEIEPFGGAATCLGGAIRDPLSGRSYVYQAMRVTGAADPLLPVHKTMKGKLPQKKIVTTAAAGYSSYGNQIGLATGHVSEVYHPGYVAKRMEIGAVLGAVPKENVVRECPIPGDVVILLGGRTGRDGCGGATGSSKSHTLSSLETCGAEVQKGNAPEERKLQRLFRNPEVSRLIKRCNDFGAGGVSVAIGELADGLRIDLGKVPKKYEGLTGTELAISESQERMAVVVAAGDQEKFIALAGEENLEATRVAQVTESPRLVMELDGRIIVDLSREFLNSNGAVKHTAVRVPEQEVTAPVDEVTPIETLLEKRLASLALCSQKGLVERFDSTIGAGTVLMPFGGVRQLTPAQAMAAKIPVLGGETSTCSLMAWGFDPEISSQSPYHGAMLAVIESVAKVISAGGSRSRCWLTFQEYFERTQNDPARWGKPFSALLGALKAQIELSVGSIGGKDSMSGTFENIDVPPTLVSFAVSTAKAEKVVSTEFKAAGHPVYMLLPEYDKDGLPVFDSVRATFDKMEALIASGKVLSCWSISAGGPMDGVIKMGMGNHIGFKLAAPLDRKIAFAPCYGGFLFELSEKDEAAGECLGFTDARYELDINKMVIPMNRLQKAWEGTLQPVFPYLISTREDTPEKFTFQAQSRVVPAVKAARPRVLIPVFPGTNCEYDTARAFRLAGAEPEIFVVRNLTGSAIEESVEAFEKLIRASQIIAIPGGFSGGDEPEGSAKFITAFFRNPRIKDAVQELLDSRDGLMCGICNGFQALVKLGLVPFGKIIDTDASCPTLTFNTIGRHQSMLVRTRVASNKSPWLMHTEPGEIHTVAISHGEGRFVAGEELVRQLAQNGQIATQYVDLSGEPTYDIRYNPNTSVEAIEGITSPDGRIFGKMGHSERFGEGLYRNVEGNRVQPIFRGAVDYYK